MGTQFGQPGRVGDIGFASRNVPGVAGVDEDHGQALIFEQIVEGTPVITGRSITTRLTCSLQELLQIQDLSRHRTPRVDCGRRGSAAAPRIDNLDSAAISGPGPTPTVPKLSRQTTT